jgi:hypothetical protein
LIADRQQAPHTLLKVVAVHAQQVGHVVHLVKGYAALLGTHSLPSVAILLALIVVGMFVVAPIRRRGLFEGDPDPA